LLRSRLHLQTFLAAAALEEGVVKETDMFYCENGNYAIADRRDPRGKPQTTRHPELPRRSPVLEQYRFGSRSGKRLGKERFYQYIRKFGFGAKTGIDLTGEVSGSSDRLEHWTRVDAATVAFGQGISVTAIQLITALSTVANQGL